MHIFFYLNLDWNIVLKAHFRGSNFDEIYTFTHILRTLWCKVENMWWNGFSAMHIANQKKMSRNSKYGWRYINYSCVLVIFLIEILKSDSLMKIVRLTNTGVWLLQIIFISTEIVVIHVVHFTPNRLSISHRT